MLRIRVSFLVSKATEIFTEHITNGFNGKWFHPLALLIWGINHSIHCITKSDIFPHYVY